MECQKKIIEDNDLLPDINVNRLCLISNINMPKKVKNIFKNNKIYIYIYIYTSGTLNLWLRNLSKGFKLNNCSFEHVKLIKNTVPDKYKYSG